MKKIAALLLASISLFSLAATPALDAEVQADIKQHKAMAAAHLAAASCLESGKSHEVCQKQLQAACKGLAIGKYCGMRHEH
jgi:hypothetical protein